jgi:hypothetical protein
VQGLGHQALSKLWGSWMQRVQRPRLGGLHRRHGSFALRALPLYGGAGQLRDALQARLLRRQIQETPLGVALQVAFERQTLKPVFSLDRL